MPRSEQYVSGLDNEGDPAPRKLLGYAINISVPILFTSVTQQVAPLDLYAQIVSSTRLAFRAYPQRKTL
jgi:hypothetical protein